MLILLTFRPDLRVLTDIARNLLTVVINTVLTVGLRNLIHASAIITKNPKDLSIVCKYIGIRIIGSHRLLRTSPNSRKQLRNTYELFPSNNAVVDIFRSPNNTLNTTQTSHSRIGRACRVHIAQFFRLRALLSLVDRDSETK